VEIFSTVQVNSGVTVHLSEQWRVHSPHRREGEVDKNYFS
jgi:hypothetical protein